MKKMIISAVTALAFLFGFASCSGDLHDAQIIDLDGYCIIGSVLESNWMPEGAPLVNNGDGTYSVTVTASATGQNSKGDTGDAFAVIQIGDTSWGTAYRLAQPKSQGDSANVFPADGGTQNVYQGQSADCMIVPGTEKGDKITIKIKPATTYIEVTVSVEKSGGASGPVPYYFDGMYLVGGCFTVGDMTNLWSFGAANLIRGAVLDELTGKVTYSMDIVATADSGEMCINDSDWQNKQLGQGVIVKTDGVDCELNGVAGNFKVEGLTKDKPYRIYISTTPEKVVSVKIEEIVNFSLKFKISGLNEGNVAWLNGSMYGSSWGKSWPLTSWDGSPEDGDIEAANGAKADASGVVTVPDSWNVSGVCKPNDELSYNFKVIANASDWKLDLEKPDQDFGDSSMTIKISTAGTYVVNIPLDGGTYGDISATKE